MATLPTGFYASPLTSGGQATWPRPAMPARAAVDVWLARSLAATYMASADEALPRTLIDLLPPER